MNHAQLDALWRTPDRCPDWSNADWEAVLGQVRQARLAAKLATHFADRGWLQGKTERPYLHLAAGLRLSERQQHTTRWEIHCIAKALRGLDIPVVLLKGAGYLMADLPPSRGRLFSDIDLMVPREHIGEVEGALFAAGWISDERDPYNQRYYREWMHEIPPLRHVQRNTYIDLHHTITPPTSRFNVDGAQLLAQIQPLQDFPGMYVLAPVDMVLHSAVHLFTEGEFSAGLRDLLDMTDLLRFFAKKANFWGTLLDQADALGLQIPLYHALFHIQRLFEYAPPPQWAQRVQDMGPPMPARMLMRHLLTVALRPDHPACDTRWAGLARWLLYVRAHALRMPLRLVLSHLIRKAWMRHFPEKKL